MCESQQRFHQVQLLSMFAGEDGGLLVMLHQFVHGAEPALADAVNSVRQLHLKVFILPHRLQRHGEVTGLEKNTKSDRSLLLHVQQVAAYPPF